MFREARLKLTAWYLLIIMLISIAFSIAIFQSLTSELDRIERVQRQRQQAAQNLPKPPSPFLRLDPEVLEESKQRIRLILIAINLIILGFSGLAGYFLAGRTLKPIKEMVDEQNRFIADSSHELRTPLTALKTETEVGLRDKNLTLTSAKNLLKDNLDEINSLQTLSDELLRLIQFEKGNGSPSLSQIKLSEVFLEAKRKVSPLARAKNIELKIPEVRYSLKAEKNSLVELLVILLDNAIKYSQKGKSVEVIAEKPDSRLVIKVKDQGQGIDPKDIPHVFDRFYRVDKSRAKASAPGYGLGLSIAKKIVELHGGSIKVESALRKGSTFIINLPTKHS